MKQVKLNANLVEAYAVTVKLSEDTTTYAKDFVTIHNDVLETFGLFGVDTCLGSSTIVVYCGLDYKEEAVTYLEQFGYVVSVAEATVYQVEEPAPDVDNCVEVFVTTKSL